VTKQGRRAGIGANPWNRTKIVATLGPATTGPAVIRDLVAAGMDVARLNFAHGSSAEHALRVRRVRHAARRLGRPVGILQDLPGPKLRVGRGLSAEIALRKGQEIFLTGERRRGADHGIPVAYPALTRDVKPGDPVFIADGMVRLTVLAVKDGRARCRVDSGGVVRSGNGVNLPGSRLSLSAFTACDKRHLDFGLRIGVDFVGISFAATAQDVSRVRDYARRQNRAPFLIAKIERREALKNLKAVIEASDGVMVARGDLGVEIPFSEVPGAQEEIIFQARQAGKPVIVATQMLESMLEQPRPTRAEVSDAANAVLDGADALMLSGETSVGRFPVHAVRALNEIIRAAELRPAFGSRSRETAARDAADVVVKNACRLAQDVSARAVAVLAPSAAARASRFRPGMPILLFVNHETLWRRFTVYAGVEAVPRKSAGASDTLPARVGASLRRQGWIRRGERFVLLAAGRTGQDAGTLRIATA
jgi:pyruvate kinase